MGSGTSSGSRGERAAREVRALREIHKYEDKLKNARKKRAGAFKGVQNEVQIVRTESTRFPTPVRDIENRYSSFKNLDTPKIKDFRSGYKKSIDNAHEDMSQILDSEIRLEVCQKNYEETQEKFQKSATAVAEASSYDFKRPEDFEIRKEYKENFENFELAKNNLEQAQNEATKLVSGNETLNDALKNARFTAIARLEEFTAKYEACSQIIRSRAAKKGHETRKKNREAREKKIAEVSATIPIRKRKNAKTKKK